MTGPDEGTLGTPSGFNRQGDLLPSRNGMGAKLAMIGGSEVFSVQKEEIGDLAVG